MELQLILDSELADVLPLIPTTLISAEKVNEWKLILVERNHEAIAAASQPPQFVLDGVPSRINRLLMLAEAGDPASRQEEQAERLVENLFHGIAHGFSGRTYQGD